MGYFLEDGHHASIVYGRALLTSIQNDSHLQGLAKYTSELGARYGLRSFGLFWSGSRAVSLGEGYWPEENPASLVGILSLAQFADEPTPVPREALVRKEIADGIWAECCREMGLSFGNPGLFLFASGWGEARLLSGERLLAFVRSDAGGYEQIGQLEAVKTGSSSLVIDSSYI